MSEQYSESCCIRADSRTRGIRRVANELADEYGLSVSVDADTYCAGGLIFKDYRTEYNIRFRGEKEKVKAAIESLQRSCMSYNARIHLPISAASGWF